eukprot:SAG31_NODE_4060_length_3629_cov_13.824363_1_plen_181_part_00
MTTTSTHHPPTLLYALDILPVATRLLHPELLNLVPWNRRIIVYKHRSGLGAAVLHLVADAGNLGFATTQPPAGLSYSSFLGPSISQRATAPSPATVSNIAKMADNEIDPEQMGEEFPNDDEFHEDEDEDSMDSGDEDADDWDDELGDIDDLSDPESDLEDSRALVCIASSDLSPSFVPRG